MKHTGEANCLECKRLTKEYFKRHPIPPNTPKQYRLGYPSGVGFCKAKAILKQR